MQSWPNVSADGSSISVHVAKLMSATMKYLSVSG